MNTSHRIFFGNAENMSPLPPESVDLVVTSPPYPMIEMWDSAFAALDPEIGKALSGSDGNLAFELMHRKLDRVWDEVHRVLRPGGFACINIGDAVRTINGNFVLYPNHSRILSYFYPEKMTPLPPVIWRKQTNAPNKFMGSGMLPAGAYVTLEHEFILVLRKGGKRTFDSDEQKQARRESALFWEERNTWFSDVWMDLKGTRQALSDKSARQRSAAFPFELPFRLINMYSVKGDTVLDPFLGTGTTLFAAMASGRNSVGMEIDPSLFECISDKMEAVVDFSNDYIRQRMEAHLAFVKDRLAQDKTIKHVNRRCGFPVVTNQEKELAFDYLTGVRKSADFSFEVSYTPCDERNPALVPASAGPHKEKADTPTQQLLFEDAPESPKRKKRVKS